MKKSRKIPRISRISGWNPFFNTNAEKEKRMILRISATTAAMMIICPYRLVISPRSLSTGTMIPTDVVIMIRAK